MLIPSANVVLDFLLNKKKINVNFSVATSCLLLTLKMAKGN